MVLHTVTGLSRKVLLTHTLPNNHVFMSKNFSRFRVTPTTWPSFHGKFLTLRERLRERLQSSFCTIVRLWGLQVNSVTAQRIRRFGQLIHIYYAEQNVKTVAANFVSRYLRGRRRNLYLLFSGTIFAWDRKQVTDQDFDSCLGSLHEVRLLLNALAGINNGSENNGNECNGNGDNNGYNDNSGDKNGTNGNLGDTNGSNGNIANNNGCKANIGDKNGCNGNGGDNGNSNGYINGKENVTNGNMAPCEESGSMWEQIIENEHLKMWRKPIPDSTLYQYTVYGSFDDISPKAFYAVQMDLEYRKMWDKFVITLEVVDKDPSSGSEIVHWIMHYPFPMYSREYVYIRQQKIDYKNNAILLVSKSVDHPKVPQNGKYVRVHTYNSQMVIKPHHRSFDKNGFDYVLTYYDDPRTHFPVSCVSYFTSAGIPDFVDKLHTAAKELQTKGNVNYRIKGLKAADGDNADMSASNLV